MKEHVCHDQVMIWEIIRSSEMPDDDGYVVVSGLCYEMPCNRSTAK